jgi:hypothetical protein
MENRIAPVAEWIRRGTSNPFYAGSNPAGGATKDQFRGIYAECTRPVTDAATTT